jgi:hypothetical protein
MVNCSVPAKSAAHAIATHLRGITATFLRLSSLHGEPGRRPDFCLQTDFQPPEPSPRAPEIGGYDFLDGFNGKT